MTDVVWKYTGVEMLRNRGEEDRPPKSSKLQAVFSKLSGVIPRAPELGSPKTMSSDIIESVLVDSPVPAPSSEYLWNFSVLA
jgi:hypothetical protein